MHKKVFVNAFKNFKVILLVPDAIAVLLILFFGALFVKLSGIWSFLKGADITSYSQEQLLEMFLNYFSVNYIAFIAYGAVFFVLNFVLGAGLSVLKYRMMAKVVRNSKINIIKITKGNFEFTKRIILLKAIMFLIGTIVFLISLVVFALFENIGMKLIGIFAAMLILLTIVFLLQVALFVVYPVMFLRNRKTIDAMKESYYYARNNFSYIFVIWIFSLVIAFVVGLVTGFSERIFVGVVGIYFAYTFLRAIINLAIKIYLDLVRFYAYKLKQ